MPTVSVLIPSYNYAQYLGATVRSVQAQTVTDTEIIIVDDGSTDGSWELIVKIAQSDPRIRAYRQINQGLIPTLNRLLDLSQAEYIAQIDADDLWLPERLAMGLADMKRSPQASAVFCGYDVIDGFGTFVSHSYHRHLAGQMGALLMESMVVRNCVCACTALMRRGAVVQAGGFAGAYSLVHDWHRWLRLSLQGHLSINAGVGALYRWHGNNQSIDEETSRRQQLAIMSDMAPKVLSHYELGSQVAMHTVAQMHALSSGSQSVHEALAKLRSQSVSRTLTHEEQMLLVLSLSATGQHEQVEKLLPHMQRQEAFSTQAHRTLLAEAARHCR